MKTFFAALTIDQLTSIHGGARARGHAPGCPCCTTKFNGNTGITGGLHVPNNHVPGAPIRSGNTGITGGLHVPNNKVPRN